MVRVALAADPRGRGHAPPGFHPERPERFDAALRGVRAAVSDPIPLGTRLASDEELGRVHAAAHIDALVRASSTGRRYLDADTFLAPDSLEAARAAAGGALALVDALIDDCSDVGLVVARPPGHHATPDRAMGFCLFNTIAVAAAHARARGTERVAIVDWDVHHGNGTQAAFERDPSVLFVSLHQCPLYPGTGAVSDTGIGDGRGSTINLPLPAGSNGSVYAACFERLLLPVLERYAPGLILVSAGFDAHLRDPLASMALEDHDFGWMASRLRALALDSAGGKLGFILEGGYDLLALERSVAATLQATLEPARATAPGDRRLNADATAALADALSVQRQYWPQTL